MSRFRGSPSRSPFRSPPRAYEIEREAIIEDEIRLKSALRAESDFRRMNDEIALLQVKVRNVKDLEDKVDSLIRQNNQLARQNDELSRQLSQKRYQIQRHRITANQHLEREALRNAQLYEANKSLQLEIELLKKQRIQGNRVYESNIVKLERILDQKVIELDSTTLKCHDLSKQLELTVIKFEEQKNRLKNIMARTEHQLQRELEYTKEKQTSEKFSEIDTLKRNYASQVALLEDEISKLKLLNQAKSQEFQIQLAENKNLRKRHDEEVRKLGEQNDDLRNRMLKLQQINRSEVQNIQVKYSDYHTQGTTSLKQQHSRQIKLLLDQIDKLKWLVSQKNLQIQNLVNDKRQLKRALDEKQLELGSEIESLKNQKYAQSEKYAKQSHEQMQRINQLVNRSLKESENYHNRAKEFGNKINKLQSQISDKQNELENSKNRAEFKIKELNKIINQANFNLEKTKRELDDSESLRKREANAHKEYQVKAQNEISNLSKKLSQTEVKLQEKSNQLSRQAQDNQGNQQILKIEVDSLRQTISILQKKLSKEQETHSNQMNEFSNKANQKLKKLQSTQAKALQQAQRGYQQQLQALKLRLEKATRDKADAQTELKRYISMYSSLQKYFKNPHDGALFEQKSQSSVYQVLEKVSKSSIHIF